MTSPQYPSPYPPYAPVPPAPHRRLVAGVAGGLLAAVAVTAVALAAGPGGVTNGIGSAVRLPATDRQGVDPYQPSGNAGGTGATDTGTATSAQSVGVVDINTVLGYQGARAAGTGIVLSSTGEILTNNHVINGATRISVTVVSTGRSYAASVVGTDPSDDVAVLQLQNASGLATAKLGNSATVDPGETVTGVGNAGGVGGTPSSATGHVLALNQPLTASDTDGQNAERLTGMIEIDAPIVAGDSGGPLYDTAGTVVGIDTAAQTNGSRTTVAYAIPINKAVTIAAQIESGTESSTIHQGLPGFLGVSIVDTAAGAAIDNVVAGGPAARAGLAAGDVITSVDGASISDGSQLKAALAGTNPGQKVALGWLDPSGATSAATVTLAAGPAD